MRFSIEQSKKLPLIFHLHQSLRIASIFQKNSFENLAKNLREKNVQVCQKFDANVLHLVKKKLFFHYDYLDIFEKFKESLPTKEKSYNSLNKRKINNENYQYFVKVWVTVEMKI